MKRFTIVFALFALFITLFPLDTLAADGGNKPYHFGFKKSKKGKPASINEEGFKTILEKHGAVFLGNSDKKELYLTFDNGYENGCTPKILDVLKAKQVPAAFFVTGHFVEDKPELVKRMTAEGHLIGNHSWSHPDMSQIPDEKIKTELDRVKNAVANLTGVQTMAFMRPPRGIFSDRVLEASKQQGYTNVFWSVAYKDWDVKDQKGWKYAYDKVIAQLHPGAVILLHSISKDNTDALDKIIDEAHKQGYEFKSLEKLDKKTY
ncbi:delta-lactam-biosynthetic de-N-acetylase [Paenibacillus sp. UNC499MF]|uniref:delta-lactam-biosynthetic de-N-acetylase n=1 Tax=Paenibacillus sp. UNC499MF TaxID=1502751 RepID=UPI0008A05577|nr:delta-lactam-biosynthetic de-N-acetylase [Paenibacillus sp. UNC499MF]SEG67150.1 peptidoglycan-N-acetylmuramic acid deacetylase [Paenibacillus sp. UNC499MF]